MATEETNSIFSDGRQFLASLGTFWSQMYAAAGEVDALVQAACANALDTHQRLQEAVQSLSRKAVPVFSKQAWKPLRILRSAATRLEDGRWMVSVPALAQVGYITNRLLSASLVWLEGDQFTLHAGQLTLPAGLFDDPRVAVRPLTVNNQADIEILLWLCAPETDLETIYNHWGYVIGLHMPSSPEYAKLVDAVLSAITQGPTALQLRRCLALLAGAPCVIEPRETVQDVSYDSLYRVIVTDQHVYRCPKAAQVIASVGDTLRAGDLLTDTVQLYQLSSGQYPEQLPGLSLDRNFISACYYAALIFPNADVPLQIDTADSSGYTKVSFGLGGFPADVEKFFDELHAKGVHAAVQPQPTCSTPRRNGTLAHLLDKRDVLTSEPTADTLPKTINPYKFLLQHVLRNNAAIAVVKLGAGINALGLSQLRLLSHFVPAQQAVLVAMTLTPAAQYVKLSNVLDSAELSVGLMPATDTVSSQRIRSRVTLHLVSATC